MIPLSMHPVVICNADDRHEAADRRFPHQRGSVSQHQIQIDAAMSHADCESSSSSVGTIPHTQPGRARAERACFQHLSQQDREVER